LSDLFEVTDGDRRERLERREPYVDLEIQRRGPDGATRVFRESGKPVFSGDGSFLGYRGTTRDVTDSHVLSQKLSYQASHDALTGLINRRQFDERLERVIDSARHNASRHVLCYLDLDQFKVINDTCGHVAGDHMLRQMSTLLKERVRIRDTVARLGGDEFAVLMEHCTLEQGERVAGALHEAVDQFRFTWNEAEFKVGVSMGLVPIDEASGPITDVLSAADSACYIAKDQGRNRIHVYRKDDIELAKRQGEMQWVGRLNRALDENRLLLYRQPIAPLNGASADPGAHFEILLRLREDDEGVITASRFLPAAERYGLGSRLDQWVVRKTFEWLSRQPAGEGAFQLCSINLSGHSLASKTFADFVLDQVQTGRVATDRICFEITETAAIENLGAATRFMGKLAGMGCKFALDDFGSGLSSFAYLKTLPVHFLKIDGFFVSNIASSPIDREMVRSIHEIGRLMGKRTIAEYADKPEVINELRRIGVDYAQGYEIGRPQPLE
jgi:diguanylate cyclase (GGDEF)-like protein